MEAKVLKAIDLSELTTALNKCMQELSPSSYLTEYQNVYDSYYETLQKQRVVYSTSNLIDNRTNTYWHSNNGHEVQHWVRLQLAPGVQARILRLSLVPHPPGKWRENHKPEKVTIMAGDDFNNMKALETVHIGKKQREVTFDIDVEKVNIIRLLCLWSQVCPWT
ncbi:uncharacterized protein LOC144862690 [Branchiostoma floridae x Branchiostoma japonicum]